MESSHPDLMNLTLTWGQFHEAKIQRKTPLSANVVGLFQHSVKIFSGIYFIGLDPADVFLVLLIKDV